ELFEQITKLEEYYPTRTELSILKDAGGEIAEALGDRCAMVEYGSGSGLKTRLLLEALRDPSGYIPVEISQTALEQSVQALSEQFPRLLVEPVRADYTRTFRLPELATRSRRRAVFFPGSTIGNFTPEQAVVFMSQMREHVGEGGAVVIGVDLKKDPAVLHAAYNDADGVTAEFNRNVLVRINSTLGANFDLKHMSHYAFYEPVHGRIEMHLVSLASQEVRIGDAHFVLEEGETILTEYSYKYTVRQFGALAAKAGLERVKTWTDPEQLFSVHYLVAK
ncbi:MAG: L-histidine N(alpha)-methyltransferase, partial [Myxococcota bacterium]